MTLFQYNITVTIDRDSEEEEEQKGSSNTTNNFKTSVNNIKDDSKSNAIKLESIFDSARHDLHFDNDNDNDNDRSSVETIFD